jgi:hypothetical protein
MRFTVLCSRFAFTENALSSGDNDEILPTFGRWQPEFWKLLDDVGPEHGL